MRILIDTNICIYREDDRIISESIQTLFRLMNIAKSQIIIHPASFDDIKRDKNEQRKQKILSKIKSYQILESPPNPNKNDEFNNKIGKIKSDNDAVDNLLIYAVYKNAVEFLITADIGIHTKSSLFGLKDRILSIDDAVELLNIYHEEAIKIPSFLNRVPVYSLDVNDPIFDKLKEDYPNFEKWFIKISKKGRKALVYKKKNDILGAVFIYKYENDSIDSIPPIPKEKRLKICTLIVTHVGYKIGELYLRKAIELAINRQYNEIYLTHFSEEKDQLIRLINEYGFVKTAYKMLNKRKEDVFLKKIHFPLPRNRENNFISLAKKYYPSFYDGEEVQKYLVPIQPQFHTKLFVDFLKRQMTLDEFFGTPIRVEGNTIKKAYLCHSRIRKIRPGDLIIFYRSKDIQALTTIGIVEDIKLDLTDSEDIIRIVGRRTVYSKNEIKEMAQKKTLVILFLFLFHFQFPIDLNKAIGLKILKQAPQTISSISHDQYLRIKKIGRIDECFTYN